MEQFTAVNYLVRFLYDQQYIAAEKYYGPRLAHYSYEDSKDSLR